MAIDPQYLTDEHTTDHREDWLHLLHGNTNDWDGYGETPEDQYEKLFGQKYNPNHDPANGRFTSGDAEAGLAREAFDAAGFSINARTGKVPRTGYMVSTVGAEAAYDPHAFNAQHVTSYIDHHRASLAQPGHYLGGWYSKEDHHIYLDVSENVANRDQAVQLGVARNQWGIYDLNHHAYLPVGSARQDHYATKLRKPSSGIDDMHVIWLDHEQPPEDMHAAIMGLVQTHSARTSRKAFNPDEPRDDHGRWTSGGAAPALPPPADTTSPHMRAEMASNMVNAKLQTLPSEVRDRIGYNLRMNDEMRANQATTMQLYDDRHYGDGVYAPWYLQKMQQAAQDAFDAAVAGGAKREAKVAVVGGLGGAGKTTLLENYGTKLGINPSEYVRVNPDDFKDVMLARGMVPGYADLRPGELATQMHDTSSDMAGMLENLAMSQGYNVLFDESLGMPDKAAKILDLTHRYGYDPANAHAVFVDVSVQKSLDNAINRWATGGTFSGRFLPPTIPASKIDETGQYRSVNRRYFEANRARFGSSVVIDNEDYAKPKIGKTLYFGR